MEKIWFRKSVNGMMWRPITWQGWIIMCAWIVTNVVNFVTIDLESHSASDTLINAAPLFIISTLFFLVIVRTRTDRRWE